MRIRGGMSLAAGVAIIVMMAGCAASPPPSVTGTAPPAPTLSATPASVATTPPTASAAATPEPSLAAYAWPTYDPASLLGERLTCFGPGSPTFTVSQWNTAPVVTQADVSPEAQALRQAQSPGNGLGRLEWRRVVTTPDSALFGASTGASPPEQAIAISVVADQLHPGTWNGQSQGNCSLRLATDPGRSVADVALAPGPSPAAADRVIHLLIRESACSGGQSPLSRVAPPVIRSSPGSATVLITISTRPGPQDCVGVDPVPYDLVLPEPLGARTLLDGSHVPALPITREVGCCG